ncbi:hypothetical protein M0R72_04665 [Candidatus Pacearchaeota archaeon]|nr:hypothetical protein [Candidatus Pacearchaeota archaeon]
MQLENLMGYQPRVQGIQTTYFVARDLENLSASALYNGDKDYGKFIDESIRFDDHEPYGEHLNYEVKLNLTGEKSGRQLGLTNVHIPFGSPDVKSGS